MSLGVILATYGEPTRNSFTEQWIYSYRILKGLTRKIAQIPAPVLPMIATARACSRVKLWKGEDFVSPLEPLHEQTVCALQDELAARELPDKIQVIRAYEFRRPNLTDALRELRTRGCDQAIVVPMYIAPGDFTDGMTQFGIDDALKRLPEWKQEQVTMCNLADTPDTVDRLAGVLADHCTNALTSRGITAPSDDWALLLAAHGTVIDPIPGVDTGLVAFGQVLSRLKTLLRPQFGLVRVGWLNHTKGGKWTTPAVPEALEYIQGRGYSRLVYFPWGFTTDNAETSLEGRMFLKEMKTPFERVEHLPCLNEHDGLVKLLADRVLSCLDKTQAPEPELVLN